MSPGLASAETSAVASDFDCTGSEPCSWDSIIRHIRAAADRAAPGDAADLREWADLLEALTSLRAD